MNTPQLLFVDPPDLSDQSASDMLDFLVQFTTAFENHYGAQLRRYYQQNDYQQVDQSDPDPVEDFNDELPPF